MKQARILRLLAATTFISALAACGGGGDGTAATPGTPGGPGTPGEPGTPTASAIDKYVGTWRGCYAAGTDSEMQTLVIAKTGETTGTFTATLTAHAGPGCTGAVLATGTDSGSLTHAGTKTVGTETVDKIDIVAPTHSEKQIVLIRADGKFYSGIPVGEPGSNPDAQGYPGVIEDVPSTKVA